MKKDTIYIDTEDDITAIIDKVKHASASIIALVPPKRVGVLQSTVNLKLLKRAADSTDKRIVLITNDQALIALAAGMSLPIARNLQSKPEIVSLTPDSSQPSDVIHGDELPVGELAEMAPLEDDDDTVTIDGTSTAKSGEELKRVTTKNKALDIGTKIPNFSSFRKKLFLFGTLGLAIVGFLVWALVFAGRATIAITARTNIVNIGKTLQLKTGAQLDATQGVLPVITKQVKKTTSVDFVPTGQKQVGDKATGSVTFYNNALTAKSVAAGTQLTTSGGLVFTLDAAVTVPSASFPCGDITCAKKGSAAGAVTAAAGGTKYNGAMGDVSGAPNGLTAALADATTGGTDKTVTTVTADDITKATDQLKTQDSNTVKDELSKQFASDEIVIAEAYIVEPGTPVSTPAVDQEATAAKLTSETTYTLLGVKRLDLKAVYDAYLSAQLKGDTSQKIYKSGDETTQFSTFQKVDGGYTIRAIGNAQVGPNIDANKVADSAKGKQIGEVQQSLEQIQGVDSVDVTLSPFWVMRVPNDSGRITVTFVLKND